MATVTGTEQDDPNLDGTIRGDTIDGKGGNDTIDAKSGADLVDGGAGADTMFAGSGFDGFLVGDGDTAAGETYDGGISTDALIISETASPVVGEFLVDFSGSTLTSIEMLNVNSTINTTMVFAGGSLGGSGMASALQVFGDSGNDKINILMGTDTQINIGSWTFTTWSTNDIISVFGDSDAETITTSSQRDRVAGGLGADKISTLGGDDTVIVDNTGAGDSYNGGDGQDFLTSTALDVDMTGAALAGFEFFVFAGSGDQSAHFKSSQFGTGLSSAANFNVGGAGKYFVNVALDETNFSAGDFNFIGATDDDILRITGTSEANSLSGSEINDLLFGDRGSDTLIAGGGNDTLDGGAEIDFMFGGAGDDLYIVDNVGDVAAEIGFGEDPGGTDRVQSVVTHTLTGFIENLTLTGALAIDGTGNAQANAIAGNKAANNLSGLGGDDTIGGGAGTDRLTGGLGVDTLTGGNGNDRYIFNDTAESGQGADARDIIKGFAAGVDKIDLRLLDARSDQNGNQDLALDVGGALASGEVRIREANGDTFVEANTDGVAGVDFQVLVQNVLGLTGADLLI